GRWRGGEGGVERDAIGGGDRSAPERAELARRRRRPPVDPCNGNALSGEGRGEDLGTGYEGPERIAEEVGLRRHRVPRRSPAPPRPPSGCWRIRPRRASGAVPPGARDPAGPGRYRPRERRPPARARAAARAPRRGRAALRRPGRREPRPR